MTRPLCCNHRIREGETDAAGSRQGRGEDGTNERGVVVTVGVAEKRQNQNNNRAKAKLWEAEVLSEMNQLCACVFSSYCHICHLIHKP